MLLPQKLLMYYAGGHHKRCYVQHENYELISMSRIDFSIQSGVSDKTNRLLERATGPARRLGFQIEITAIHA